MFSPNGKDMGILLLCLSPGVAWASRGRLRPALPLLGSLRERQDSWDYCPPRGQGSWSCPSQDLGVLSTSELEVLPILGFRDLSIWEFRVLSTEALRDLSTPRLGDLSIPELRNPMYLTT
jgi:hypothetical protein